MFENISKYTGESNSYCCYNHFFASCITWYKTRNISPVFVLTAVFNSAPTSAFFLEIWVITLWLLRC